MEEIKEYKTQLIAVLIVTVGILGLLSLIKKEEETVNLHVLRAGSQVFIDREAHTRTTEPNQKLSLSLPVGEHNILVAAHGHWPWGKEIVVRKDTPQDIVSFSVPKQPSRTTVEPSSPQYQDIVSQIESISPPTQTDPLASQDNTVEIWAEENSIKARWSGNNHPIPAFCENGSCSEEITVHENTAPVQSLSFYRHTNSVIIFSAGDTIGVLEIDPHGETQNFHPVYTGTAPLFIQAEDGGIYVKDNTESVTHIRL